MYVAEIEDLELKIRDGKLIIYRRESVGLLVKIKEMLENLSRTLFGGKLSEEVLLGL